MRPITKEAITKEEIDAIQAPSPWDLGNQVLYDMCQKYPWHREHDEIIAKIWLIGRSYSVAIERCKNPEFIIENCYEAVVAPTMLNQPIDMWLASTQDVEAGDAITVAVHKKLTDLFFSMTKLNNRSLASKYLHFHKPDVFFIYDSKACQSITKFVPRLSQLPELETEDCDIEYRDFVRRCVWLRDDVQENFGIGLTPRQIDNLLLKNSKESSVVRSLS